MRDKVSIERVKLLHPSIRNAVISFITEAEEAMNITLRITQGLRTIEEQNKLYAQGRTLPGSIVTNAKGGKSYHNYGLAIDLVEINGGQANWKYAFKNLLPFAEKYGFEWGGNFKSIKDDPHFQKTFGLTWQELFARTQKGQFVEGKYVTLT